jgi:toxin ParE1/3/4
MARYKLAKSAEDDLNQIADYTIETFGIEQARKYRDLLIEAFNLISDNPHLGRDCSKIREGYRRFDHQSHLIFYRITNTGVLIAHILGGRQDITKDKF